MVDCSRCGTPNPEGSRFCNSCGASLVTRVGVQERRVVTALFADLARSTSMGERLDPEVTRRVVGDFFDLARTEIERRGGTVEKFSGDAVMAVFGLPQAHEDDPERAVRAAIAIREGLARTASAVQERHGIIVEARIGIESGEVVVGDPFGGGTMATGDAMNLAARLEQQAEPGEIVVGAAAHDHVRDLVQATALGALQLRGHDEPLAGWRVESVAEEVGRPRGVPGLHAPLTGRDEELSLLLDAADRAERGRKAVLFTMIGVPGVGKSRLLRETGQRLADRGWNIVRGRCLPYGDGITYWPVQEMVRSITGIEPDMPMDQALARLTAVAPDADVAARLALVLGLESGGQSNGGGDREIAWGFRRLVEHVAADRGPQLLVFEDIHWAEPPLLDLIEYLVTWARDVPLLVVCPARPELLDTRPTWGSGRMEASRIMLEPLTEEESRQLLAALLSVDDLPAQLRQRVLDRAEGNPLFVEEVVRMLIEEGLVERRDDHWVAKPEAADVPVPDSVEALIRARLDTLPVPERGTLQAASVVGRVFQSSAVASISPDNQPGSLERQLEEAILHDLITDERVPDEPTFRFRHILIRDVAYATLPKTRRADLHRGVAAWLRSWSRHRVDEFVEIEAYHLEQAALLRREVDGSAPEDLRDLAVTALERSAQTALARDDARATRSFAERALALNPAIEQRMELEWLMADSLQRTSDYRAAGEIGKQLEQEARQAGRKDLEGRAVLVQGNDLWVGGEKANADEALVLIRRAHELLIEAGDFYFATRTLEMMGWEGWWRGDSGLSLDSWEKMRDLAREHGWIDREIIALTLLGRRMFTAQVGPEAAKVLIEARALTEKGSSRFLRARVDRALGVAVEFYGPIDGVDQTAEELLESAGAVLEEFGDRQELNIALVHLGDINKRAGRYAESLVYYERSMEVAADHAGYRPESQRRVAQALVALGDIERAEREAEEAVATVADDDTYTVSSARMALGLVREAQGRIDEAEQLLRSSVEILSGLTFGQGETELSLALFLLRHGRSDGPAMAEHALDHVRKLGPKSPLLASATEKIAAAAREGGVTYAPR